MGYKIVSRTHEIVVSHLRVAISRWRIESRARGVRHLPSVTVSEEDDEETAGPLPFSLALGLSLRILMVDDNE